MANLFSPPKSTSLPKIVELIGGATPNLITPDYSVTGSFGKDGKFTRKVTESKALQQQRTQQNALARLLYGQASGMAQGLNNGQAAQDAAYQKSMAYIQPEQDLQSRRAQSYLANRGLPTGSEAATSHLDQLNRNQVFEREQARLGAIQAGRADQQSQIQNLLALIGGAPARQANPTLPGSMLTGGDIAARDANRTSNYNSQAKLWGDLVGAFA